MTKTELVKRGRSVRSHLGHFNDMVGLQHVRDYVRNELNADPDVQALTQLLAAQEELNELVKLFRDDYVKGRKP